MLFVGRSTVMPSMTTTAFFASAVHVMPVAPGPNANASRPASASIVNAFAAPVSPRITRRAPLASSTIEAVTPAFDALIACWSPTRLLLSGPIVMVTGAAVPAVKPEGVGNVPDSVPKLIVSVPSPMGALRSATGADATVCRCASCVASRVCESEGGLDEPLSESAIDEVSLLITWRPSAPLFTSEPSAVEKALSAELIVERLEILASTAV